MTRPLPKSLWCTRLPIPKRGRGAVGVASLTEGDSSASGQGQPVGCYAAAVEEDVDEEDAGDRRGLSAVVGRGSSGRGVGARRPPRSRVPRRMVVAPRGHRGALARRRARGDGALLGAL